MNLIVALFALMATTPTATTQSEAAPPPIALRVAVVVDPPFVTKADDGTYCGFTIELWERIASDLGATCTYTACASAPELIDAVSARKCDVGVGDITITRARNQLVDFSHPYFDSGLRVMINQNRSSSFARLWRGLSEHGYVALAGIATAALLVATGVVTVINRSLDASFPRAWHAGLAESFYHVTSIAMTGKSNHKGFPGPLGRVLAGVWIVCGVALVAFITSSVTSVMTAESIRSEISGPDDLARKTVGVMTGSTGLELARQRGWETSEFAELERAVSALVARDIQAIVYDAPVLQYYDNSHPELPITEVGPLFDTQKYGFVLPQGSPHRIAINIALLKLQESTFAEKLRARYFGNP